MHAHLCVTFSSLSLSPHGHSEARATCRPARLGPTSTHTHTRQHSHHDRATTHSDAHLQTTPCAVGAFRGMHPVQWCARAKGMRRGTWCAPSCLKTPTEPRCGLHFLFNSPGACRSPACTLSCIFKVRCQPTSLPQRCGGSPPATQQCPCSILVVLSSPCCSSC
jgi:hypothetical protein